MAGRSLDLPAPLPPSDSLTVARIMRPAVVPKQAAMNSASACSAHARRGDCSLGLGRMPDFCFQFESSGPTGPYNDGHEQR